MSGGSFNYACDKVSRFADELEERLNVAGQRRLPLSPYHEDVEPEFSPAVMVALRDLVGGARAMAKMMHAAEWLYSGDYDEESFMEEFMEALEGKQ